MSCNPCATNNCLSKYGCPPNICPDFVIKRHDTKPPFKVVVKDCDGPLDLTGLVLEVSMWAKARTKKAVSKTDTYFGFADDIGFEQVLPNDVIVMEGPRVPEQMLVTAFDEENKLIQVTRGYHGTPIQNHKKGARLKILRTLNAAAETEMVYEDQIQIDGTVQTDVLTESRLVYEWQPNDTCVPGCYWLEFKLIKMQELTIESLADVNVVPSFTYWNPSELGCDMGSGVEWVRRFPVEEEGFLIKIEDSSTSENVF